MSGDETWNIGRFGLVDAFEDQDKLTALEYQSRNASVLVCDA